MEMRRSLRASALAMLAVGFVMTGHSTNGTTFGDCYTKCFVFCMIEPSQTLCSCTTHCFTDCIFQGFKNDVHDDSHNLGFCKLGCALTKCSAFSSKHTPNGDKVDGCVGSCSNKCIKSYSLSP